MADKPFWQRKKLAEMTRPEWESLCDGCGKCCLHKIEDFVSAKISYTNVACRLFDSEQCRCTDYANRTTQVPDCVKLTPENISTLRWMPSTCAYRLLDEGKDLEWWHPLVSGDPETVAKAGMSVKGRTVDEEDIDNVEDYIVKWAG
jgi:uncharacterized cysteine cluster protein YcgN (CxxCxxCC family)